MVNIKHDRTWQRVTNLDLCLDQAWIRDVKRSMSIKGWSALTNFYPCTWKQLEENYKAFFCIKSLKLPNGVGSKIAVSTPLFLTLEIGRLLALIIVLIFSSAKHFEQFLLLRSRMLGKTNGYVSGFMVPTRVKYLSLIIRTSAVVGVWFCRPGD